MNSVVVILIIILIVLILIGLGVGLYFALRKKPKPTPGQTGSTGSTGATGIVGTPINLIPAGSTGATGMSHISISPLVDSTKYITYSSTLDSQGNNPFVVAAVPNVYPCDNYSWQNLDNATLGGFTFPTILKSDTITYIGRFPALMTLGTSDGDSARVSVNLGPGEFVYDRFGKTWCAPNFNKTATYCLYLELDGQTVTAKTLDPSDIRFQWNNVPAINC